MFHTRGWIQSLRNTHGYDPVAYFVEQKPVAGSADLTAKYKGSLFRFASAASRDRFRATPDAFAPQYGGLCALGVAKGERSVNVDPEAWRIVDGKLYLFFGKAGLEQDWDSHPAVVVAKADANWPAIEAKLVAR